MKKYILVAVAAISMGVVGCSKKDKNDNYNNYTSAPNSCFNSGGPNRYQWVNGQCQDVQQNRIVSQNYCTNSQYGNTYDPRCNYYGGNQFYPGTVGGGGYYNGGNNCSIYDNYQTGERFYPVYLPQAGGYVCIGSSTYNYIGNYYGYMPSYYYNSGYLRGCYPGVSSCSCKSFGGSLGWYYGGISIGICF